MKPILFNTDMVRSIQENRKTVTRRAVKPQPVERPALKMCPDDVWRLEWWNVNEFNSIKVPICIGDILYVRETWTKLYYVDPDGYTHFDQTMYYYAADGTPDITLVNEDGFELDDQRIRWRPSIHMPHEAARIFLRVTDVRVERLNDISERSAQFEGASLPLAAQKDPEYAEYTGGYYNAFAELWNSTIKKADRALYGWDANPYVWVIEFERIRKEDKKDGLQRAD